MRRWRQDSGCKPPSDGVSDFRPRALSPGLKFQAVCDWPQLIFEYSIMTQWQQCFKILDFNCRLGCTKNPLLFFVQNDRPANWWWCQICQYFRKLWWSSYAETAAEMLPKDGSSKVAWPLRPCNVCLFFIWRRATMKIEGFLMVVCCLQRPQWRPGQSPWRSFRFCVFPSHEYENYTAVSLRGHGSNSTHETTFNCNSIKILQDSKVIFRGVPTVLV